MWNCEGKNTLLFWHGYILCPRMCFEYRYEILHQRDVRRIPLGDRSNQEYTVDGKVTKNTRRLKEDWQRAAQHISNLRDEGNFLCKKARSNVDKAIASISSRVKDSNEEYWKYILWVMILLKGNINDVLTLEANDTNTLTWYINVELAVKADI